MNSDPSSSQKDQNLLIISEESSVGMDLQVDSQTVLRVPADSGTVTHHDTLIKTDIGESSSSANVIPLGSALKGMPKPGSRSFRRWADKADERAREEILELIRAHASDCAGPAFIEGMTDRSLGWADIARRCDQWGAIGAETGMARETRVGLLISDPLQMTATFVAVLTSGLSAVPFNPSAMPSELIEQCRSLGVSEVLAGPDELRAFATAFEGSDQRIWTVDQSGIQLSSEPGIERVHTSGSQSEVEAALILSSSGTTGTPKLIPLRLDALLHCARGVVSHNEFSPTDRGYSPLPLFHINGLVVGVLSAVVGGYTLVVDRRFSASQFWQVAERHRVTWINVVPAIISLLASRPAPPEEVSHRVRFARSASAPLPLATLERFESLTGIAVTETYGMTEGGSQITANPRPPGLRKPGSVGLAVGLELRVVDDAKRPLSAGQTGSVEIRGRSVVSEYGAPVGAGTSSRPALDAQGWLSTGDIGHLDQDGYLFLAGRSDDVINRGGEKVYPREIEEILLREPEVDVAAVVGKPDPVVGEIPVAFVIAISGCDTEELTERLRRRVEAELSGFRRPEEIHLVNSLPSGTNGKIKRSEIRRTLLSAES